MSASFVLDSSKSSTYPRWSASGFDSPAALLDELFEHPAGVVSYCATRADGRSPRVQHCFTVVC
jgi:hypothetical protein